MKLVNKLNHIAIIPDGNRRWSQKRGLNSWIGHYYGGKTLKKVLKRVLELKIPYFTFWACSKDNLEKRSKNEVKFLLKLFEKEFKKLIKTKEIHKNKVKIRILGFWQELFPEKLKKVFKDVIEATKDYNNYNLNFLMAYDGKEEIQRVVEILAKISQEQPNFKITPEVIKSHLITNELPPVDLVIRTGGEPHLSAGFMMWEVADSQLYFIKKLWPDFTGDDLEKAVLEYNRRERKFGA